MNRYIDFIETQKADLGTKDLQLETLKYFFTENSGEITPTSEANVFLNEVFNSEFSDLEPMKVEYSWYKSARDGISNEAVFKEIGEEPYDLSTHKGWIEAMKRLSFTRNLIIRQLEGYLFDPLDRGYTGFIGMFKLTSGHLLSIGVDWRSMTNHWGCDVWHPGDHCMGRQYFLSHMGES